MRIAGLSFWFWNAVSYIKVKANVYFLIFENNISRFWTLFIIKHHGKLVLFRLSIEHKGNPTCTVVPIFLE